MHLSQQISGLYTDYYELTMAQGYFLRGIQKSQAVFDYFFRKHPFEGGYVVFAGLDDLLEMLTDFSFSDDSIMYLEDKGFDQRFLHYLSDFKFKGNVFSVNEGEVVFPYEPCLRIEGNIIETQLVETMVLNVINYESLVATKAARIRHAAGDRHLVDFGMRRAQGFGGIQGSRAAIIGGFHKTSNTYSAVTYGVEPTGTMAHSWIQSFDDEVTAFRTYAKLYPEACTLLVDTFDTIHSGLPNAILVAREMEEQGQKLKAIRIDSGDLSSLSKKARKMLDMAGLEYVQILASNQLDEYIIESLMDQSAPVDGFGVGTSLITGKDTAALDGVYKLSMIHGEPTLKVSENQSKTTLPGRKEVYRYTDNEGQFRMDAIALDEDNRFRTMADPFKPENRFRVGEYNREKIVLKFMDQGKVIIPKRNLQEISNYARQRLSQLPAEYKRFIYPHIYLVGISVNLLKMRNKLRSKNRAKFIIDK